MEATHLKLSRAYKLFLALHTAVVHYFELNIPDAT
jgi:hypothetical protein